MNVLNQLFLFRKPHIGVWLLVCVMSGCSQTETDVSMEESPAPSQPAVSVQVAQAEVTTLRPTLDLVGVVVAIPEKTAVISPQLGGWVSKLDVVEGQSVHKNQLLVELDPRSVMVALQRTTAVVAEKTAAVQRLKSGYLPEEIAGASQDAENAAAMLDGLQNELRALKDLRDRNEISAVIYETKAKAVKSAEAALASVQEKVKLLEAGTRPEFIAEAQGILDAAKADLAQAKLTLEWCSIHSPIDGVMVQLLARQGQFFDRAVPLATVMDLSNVFVQFSIPNREFSKVRQGTKVNVELSSFPEKTIAGEVTRISGQADMLTGNVVVFATIENKDHLFRPGLSCQVHVALPEIADALVIPLSAVADNSGTSVVTVIRDNKAYETEVKLGVETKDSVQILSGLHPGETITTAGGYGLPEGCEVQVVSVPDVSLRK